MAEMAPNPPNCVAETQLDSLIKGISNHIGRDWRSLARSLGFTQTDIDGIEYANERQLKEQICQFFYAWKRRDGDDATLDKLVAAVVDANLEKLLNTLANKGLVGKSDPPPLASPTPLVPAPPPPITRNRLDSDVVPDSAGAITGQPSSSTQQSPNLGATKSDLIINDLNTDVRDEREFVRNKRLQRLEPNTANADVRQRTDSSSSLPEPSIDNTIDSNTMSNVTCKEPVTSSGDVLKLLLPNVLPQGKSPQKSGDEKSMLRFCVPVDRVGLVIGQRGKNIKKVQTLTNTKIEVEDDNGRTSAGNRIVCIQGSEKNQKEALEMIENHLKKIIDQQTADRVSESVQIPEDKVGLVIGRKGRTKIKIKYLSGVQDILIADDPASGSARTVRKCTIIGSREAVEKAKRLVDLTVKGENIERGASAGVLEAGSAILGGKEID